VKDAQFLPRLARPLIGYNPFFPGPGRKMTAVSALSIV
jgi:hypothetical protein